MLAVFPSRKQSSSCEGSVFYDVIGLITWVATHGCPWFPASGEQWHALPLIQIACIQGQRFRPYTTWPQVIYQFVCSHSTQCCCIQKLWFAASEWGNLSNHISLILCYISTRQKKHYVLHRLVGDRQILLQPSVKVKTKFISISENFIFLCCKCGFL